MRRADLLREGHAVSLADMLLAREQRAARLACYPGPLISFTLVAPGPVKDNRMWRKVAARARDAVVALCQEKGWASEEVFRIEASSGAEWIRTVCAPAEEVKRALVALEQHHPLGRLWDLDTIDETGRALSRRALGLADRLCLICDREAHLCARARTHSLELLLDDVARRIENDERNDKGESAESA